jgi:antitoxin (DNA-binding transcriptional repressor) of toxin-antitoxin stability system
MVMSAISVQEIERDPSAFVRRIEAGEVFVVIAGQRPLAEVRPLPENNRDMRPFGLCAGQFSVPEDFDSPLPESLLGDFEGL